MSGDDLRVRLEVAIRDAMANQRLIGAPMPDRLQAGLVAGLEVVAADLGDPGRCTCGPVLAARRAALLHDDGCPAAGPEPAPPLPTTEGTWIIVTEQDGHRLRPPEPAVYLPDSDDDGVPWRIGDTGIWASSEQITGWQPAAVVPAHVPEAAATALREVVRLLDGPQADAAQEAQDMARLALTAIEGDLQ